MFLNNLYILFLKVQKYLLNVGFSIDLSDNYHLKAIGVMVLGVVMLWRYDVMALWRF